MPFKFKTKLLTISKSTKSENNMKLLMRIKHIQVQSGPGSNGNKWVLHTPQISRTEA